MFVNDDYDPNDPIAWTNGIPSHIDARVFGELANQAFNVLADGATEGETESLQQSMTQFFDKLSTSISLSDGDPKRLFNMELASIYKAFMRLFILHYERKMKRTEQEYLEDRCQLVQQRDEAFDNDCYGDQRI